MSQENVEVVRGAYEAMNNREVSRMSEFLDPEVVFDMSRNILNPDVYRGFAGLERLMGVVEDVWDDFHFEPEELIDAGDRVVARIKISGRGRGSGVKTEMHVFNVWTLRHGKVVRLEGGYRERAEALEAAGVEE
ncbi:MAG: nuclear transport factor 2 family protein [Actinomycetota bacterium]